MNSIEKVDVAVVGAGQAGLAAGQALKATGLRFILLDAAARIGESWRDRYDSLRLFSPRSLSALPGLALSGPADGYPSKDEIADYLRAYARHMDLPVRLGWRVAG